MISSSQKAFGLQWAEPFRAAFLRKLPFKICALPGSSTKPEPHKQHPMAGSMGRSWTPAWRESIILDGLVATHLTPWTLGELQGKLENRALSKSPNHHHTVRGLLTLMKALDGA